MNSSLRPLALAFLLSAVSLAQVNIPNQACGGPQSATTVGNLLALDQSGLNARIGMGSIQRSAGPANASYLPTGWAIDPTANGSVATPLNPPGFTIQFWYRPNNGGIFHYIFGDAQWIGPTGAFRLFANGAAGVNQILLRGPSTQLVSTSAPMAPLNLSMNNGWVNLAYVYNNVTSTLALFVNGNMDSIVTTAFTGIGTNLTMCGYNGSTSVGPDGWIDDIRLYDYARPQADIQADLNSSAGSCAAPTFAPSSDLATPGRGYYEFEAAQNDHTLSIGVDAEMADPRTRLFTAGTTLSWGAASTAGNFVATHILNVNGPLVGGAATATRASAYLDAPPLPLVHVTPGLAALTIGHGFSIPAAPFSVAFGDGLGLGAIPGLFTIALPIFYDYNSPPIAFVVPGGIFTPGDRIDIQTISFDTTWPLSVGATNRSTFVYVDALPGEHAHIEARGVNVIQNTGFWEVWNTGGVDITQVVIDLTTTTGSPGLTWEPTGALNSGGTLATGDSYRYNTHLHTGLVGGTFTPLLVNPGTGFPGAIQFDFTGFNATINHFLFDCDTNPATGSGAFYAGATVTVTYSSGMMQMGTLAIDPADPMGAILDL